MSDFITDSTVKKAIIDASNALIEIKDILKRFDFQDGGLVPPSALPNIETGEVVTFDKTEKNINIGNTADSKKIAETLKKEIKHNKELNALLGTKPKKKRAKKSS